MLKEDGSFQRYDTSDLQAALDDDDEEEEEEQNLKNRISLTLGCFFKRNVNKAREKKIKKRNGCWRNT